LDYIRIQRARASEWYDAGGGTHILITRNNHCTDMRIRKFRASDAVEVARLHRNTIRNINSKDYSKEQIAVWSGRTSAKRFRESMNKFIRFVG